jgi:hypothetical protein
MRHQFFLFATVPHTYPGLSFRRLLDADGLGRLGRGKGRPPFFQGTVFSQLRRNCLR